MPTKIRAMLPPAAPATVADDLAAAVAALLRCLAEVDAAIWLGPGDVAGSERLRITHQQAVACAIFSKRYSLALREWLALT
jgi:hypothetical protein